MTSAQQSVILENLPFFDIIIDGIFVSNSQEYLNEEILYICNIG